MEADKIYVYMHLTKEDICLALAGWLIFTIHTWLKTRKTRKTLCKKFSDREYWKLNWDSTLYSVMATMFVLSAIPELLVQYEVIKTWNSSVSALLGLCATLVIDFLFKFFEAKTKKFLSEDPIQNPIQDVIQDQEPV